MQTPREILDNQRNAWDGSAAGWERSDTWYRRNFAPVIEWLCDAVGAAPGRALLDVACGSGQPALLAASRVGASGKVVAVDLSRQMLAVAARKAQDENLHNIEFAEMGAEELSFPDGAFDGVTCGFAMMFVPDPVRAAREMRRVLRSGGRVALSVWDLPGNNPFFTSLGAVLREFFPGPPPDPKAPGAFRLAPDGELAGVLRAAGFEDIDVQRVPLRLEFASADEHWRVVTGQAGGLEQRIATLTEVDQASLRLAMRDAVVPFHDGDRLRIAASALCATARAA